MRIYPTQNLNYLEISIIFSFRDKFNPRVEIMGEGKLSQASGFLCHLE